MPCGEKELAVVEWGASGCMCLALYRWFLYALAHACSCTATTMDQSAGDAGDSIGQKRTINFEDVSSGSAIFED